MCNCGQRTCQTQMHYMMSRHNGWIDTNLFFKKTGGIDALLLQNIAQAAQSFHLYPTYSFSGQAYLSTHIFQSRDFMSFHAKTANKDFPLLGGELFQPYID